MRCFLLFVDGIGLGRNDPICNPFVPARLPHLTALLGGRPFVAQSFPYYGDTVAAIPIDPCLGVAGLPQSATGQTAILTGTNAPAYLGRHLNGYPTPRLRTLLNEHSLFKQVRVAGRSAGFLNAYRDEFFAWLHLSGGDPAQVDRKATMAIFADRPGLPRQFRRFRPSASTVAVLAAGLPFFGLADLRSGAAVYHDITNQVLQGDGLSYGVESVSPALAGRRAAATAQQYDFVMFEYFQTDLAGHRQNMQQAISVLETLDSFVGGLLSGLNPDEHLLILVSDHGNLEDLTVKTHTRNAVPAIVWGSRAQTAVKGLRDLTGILPAVMGAIVG